MIQLECDWYGVMDLNDEDELKETFKYIEGKIKK